jgi:hypothetical protein
MTENAKSVESLLPVHKKQLSHLAGKRLGLLIDFHMPLIEAGIARSVNGLEDDDRAKPPSRKEALRYLVSLSLGAFRTSSDSRRLGPRPSSINRPLRAITGATPIIPIHYRAGDGFPSPMTTLARIPVTACIPMKTLRKPPKRFSPSCILESGVLHSPECATATSGRAHQTTPAIS